MNEEKKEEKKNKREIKDIEEDIMKIYLEQFTQKN